MKPIYRNLLTLEELKDLSLSGVAALALVYVLTQNFISVVFFIPLGLHTFIALFKRTFRVLSVSGVFLFGVVCNGVLKLTKNNKARCKANELGDWCNDFIDNHSFFL